MVKRSITPKGILHFNRRDVVEDDFVDGDMITLDNILEKSSSDNVSDAMKNLYGTHGLLGGVKSLNPKSRVAGFIRTVETSSYDWGTGIKAIYECERDEILFIKSSDTDFAIWGGLASASAKKHGVRATIIVGSSRDTEDILEMDFPVFSVDVRSAAGLPLNKGSFDSKIFLDGMVIESGDFAVCDADGVVIIPRDRIDEVICEVNRIKAFESDCFRKVVEDNQRLDDVVGF